MREERHRVDGDAEVLGYIIYRPGICYGDNSKSVEDKESKYAEKTGIMK